MWEEFILSQTYNYVLYIFYKKYEFENLIILDSMSLCSVTKKSFLYKFPPIIHRTIAIIDSE